MSLLPPSLVSHLSSLPHRATNRTHVTWTVHFLAGTMLYVFVRVRSLASAALVHIMYYLYCSLIIWCASLQMPSQGVACWLNCMTLSPTTIFPISCDWRCFSWPCTRMNYPAYSFAVLNCSPWLPANWILFAEYRSSNVTTRFTSLPITTQLRFLPKNSSSTGNTFSSTRLINSEM